MHVAPVDTHFAEYDFCTVAEALEAEVACWEAEAKMGWLDDIESSKHHPEFFSWPKLKNAKKITMADFDKIAIALANAKLKDAMFGFVDPTDFAEALRAQDDYPTRLARFKAALTSDDEMPEFHP